MKNVALVLSGGGSRGAIQLGVLQAFDEYNIKIEATDIHFNRSSRNISVNIIE